MMIYPRTASRSMMNPAPVIGPRNVSPAVLAALKAALMSHANPMSVIHPQQGFQSSLNSSNNPMPVISPQNAPGNEIRSASNPMPVISPQGAGRPVFDIGPGGALLERAPGGNWYRASWGENHQNQQAPQNQGASPVDSGGPPLFPKPPFRPNMQAPQNIGTSPANAWGVGGDRQFGAPNTQGPQNQNLEAIRQAFMQQMLARMNNHFASHSNRYQ